MSYGINYSPLGGKIWIGRTNQARTQFQAKEDQTIPAALAVVEWVRDQHGGEAVLRPADSAGHTFRLTVTVDDG